MGITYVGTSHAIIDAPGDYTIENDMTQTDPNQPCIYINPGVNFVIIRLRSRLVGAGGTASQARGIQGLNSAAITVIGDGGSISGFYYGIDLQTCYLSKVKDVAILDALFRGIHIEGDDAIVEGCDVRNIGGTTLAPTALTCAIEVFGARPKVMFNYIENVVGTLNEALGISITDKGIGGVVSFNGIRNPVLAPILANGNSPSYGVWVGGASDVEATHNLIDGWGTGIAYSSPPSGMIDFNAFKNCTTPIVTSDPAHVVVGTNG